MDGDRERYCEACRDKARPGKPRCGRCAWRAPKLLPENGDAWRLWTACSTQRRWSFDGPVGLDYAGVGIAARWLGLDMRIPRLHRSLQALEDEWLRTVAERRGAGEGE
jgi:hypothetical protein